MAASVSMSAKLDDCLRGIKAPACIPKPAAAQIRDDLPARVGIWYRLRRHHWNTGFMSMKIAVIGAGNVGGSLGTGWAGKGHSIVFGVRDTSKPALKALCAQIGATAALPGDAARHGDVVVLALPWNVAENAVKALGDLRDKIVIDTMNPLAMKDGALGLERGYTHSGGEAVASWLPGARIVKTFNQVGAEMMMAGARFPTPPAMFLAGDDDGAKSTVAGLVGELGFEALDAGALKQARILEPFAMVWINQALFRGLGRNWAFGVIRAKHDVCPSRRSDRCG